ncbi:MAG: acyl-CoA dehydrogenase [Alphaproteobacteria bacterium]|nr:acyl-CoA dehydrogenase [Alphaproteobacteria bacterium]
MQAFRFEPTRLPPDAEALRGEVRDFLAEAMPNRSAVHRATSWSGWDPGFSRKLGERGWIGLTWPKRYGGHERSAFERYVLLEELLAAGAPVSAHWVADRQSGPLLLRFGTEAQRQAILPRIARGELYFCIGMSEPDSGSDLASIRTRAIRQDGGYLVNGTKVWTSNAQHCDYMIALFRTDPNAESKHQGLSQFLVPTKTKGISIRPIRNLAGEEHFNEVVFQDAFIPADSLVGKEGEGWKQVTTELAFERSGPERYLSSFQLLLELIREISQDPSERGALAVGRLVAHLATIRQMSISVSGLLQQKIDPALEASVVKDLGTNFEQELPEVAQMLIDCEPSANSAQDFEQVLAHLRQIAVSFTLRGGTREILRGIIARGLGLR